MIALMIPSRIVCAARIYFGTDTHIDPLVIGCILAAFPAPSVRAQFVPWLLLALMWWQPADLFTWKVAATGPLCAWIIAASISSGTHNLLASEPARWLGQRSYSLYLWHVPVMKVLLLSHVGAVERALIGVPISMLLAMASHDWIEQLRHKNRDQLFAMFKFVPSEPKI